MSNMYDINLHEIYYIPVGIFSFTNIINFSIWNLLFFPECVYVLYCINNFESKYSTPKTNAYIDKLNI